MNDLAKKRAAKKAPAKRAPRKPADRKPKGGEPQEIELTENDFKVDPGVLMQMIGVDPRSVKPDSVHLTFTNGVAVLEYGIVRAVPPKILGIAMLRAAENPENSDVSRETNTEQEQAGEPED